MHLAGGLVIRWPAWTEAALVGHLARSTGVALLILVILAVARRASARTRWIVGWLGLIKFILPVIWFAPALARVDALLPAPWSELPVVAHSPTMDRTEAAGSHPLPVPLSTGGPLHSPPISWPLVVGGIWATGAILLWGEWWLRGDRFRRRLLVNVRPVSHRLRFAMDRAAARAGLAAPPDCVTIPGTMGPAILGVWRPVIVLPETLEASLSTAEIEALLIHEFIHWRRRDTLLAGIQALLVRLFWFDPIVWLLHRQLSIETEKSCDEAVLAITVNPEIYAGGILKMVRLSLGLQAPGCAGATGIPIVARMKNILAHSVAVHRRGTTLAAISLAVGLVALSGFAGSIRAEEGSGQPAGRVLIFRNGPSWDRVPDFEEVLTGLGQDFVEEKSAEMAGTDFSPYRLIIIPGGQPRPDFYGDYAKAAPKFARFVRNGGTLLLELNGAENAGLTLPGGTALVAEPSFVNVITQPQHPALAALAGQLQISGNAASHGYLDPVPPGAIILAAEMVSNRLEDNLAKPTYLEYSYGAGRVIAACQGFYDQGEAHRLQLLPAVLKYALARQWYVADAAAYQQVSAAAAAVTASEEEGWTAILRLDSRREARLRGLETVVKPPLAPGLRPVSTLTNAGTASPQATMETLAWALHHGDLAALAKLIQFNSGGEGSAAALYARLPESVRSQLPSAEAMIAATLAYAIPMDVGFRIGADSPSGGDPNERLMECQTQLVGGPVQTAGFYLQKVGGNWKVLIGWKVVAEIEPTLAKVARRHISADAN